MATQSAGPTAPPTPPTTTSEDDSDVEQNGSESGEDDDSYSCGHVEEDTFNATNEIAGEVESEAHSHANHTAGAIDESAQCVCTLLNDDSMIQCATCGRWFHLPCVHLRPDTIPASSWYCHFEVNSTTKPYNNAGNRMNELESRALFLTVKHFAPLNSRFWENVSEYMLSNFNIIRSVTSVKMEWLRYSSAWFGFDERNENQYREEDVAARKALFRSSQKDVKQPPLLWKWLGIPLDQYDGMEVKKQRKPRVLNKPASKPRTAKRKIVVVSDDSDSDDELPVPAVKRTKTTTRAPVPPPTVGGKWIGSEKVFKAAAPQTPETQKTLREADLAEQSAQFVDSAAANAAAISMARNSQLAVADSAENGPFSLIDPALESKDTTPLLGLEEPTSPSSLGGNILSSIYPTDGPIDYFYCSSDPAPVFESRFDALAAHRHHVKDMLKEVELNLDWFEGPWAKDQSELLWTGYVEPEWAAMFSTEAGDFAQGGDIFGDMSGIGDGHASGL